MPIFMTEPFTKSKKAFSPELLSLIKINAIKVGYLNMHKH